MAVRIRVRLEALCGTSPGSSVETAALVNTGYEAQSPDCSVPKELARRLGLWPPPREARLLSVRGYAGRVDVYKALEALTLAVIVSDRRTQAITVHALLAEGDDEVILSDVLAERLAIDAVRPASGIWRFVDEGTDRSSVPPDRW